MILYQLNKLLMAALLVFSLSCYSSDCPDEISNTFVLRNWEGKPPTTVNIVRYKKDVDFKLVEEIYSSERIIIGKPELWEGRLYLDLSVKSLNANQSLPISSDYKIIINGKTEYRISKITSSNRINLGCPLASHDVNGHSDGGKSILFDQVFGEPVKQQ